MKVSLDCSEREIFIQQAHYAAKKATHTKKRFLKKLLLASSIFAPSRVCILVAMVTKPHLQASLIL